MWRVRWTDVVLQDCSLLEKTVPMSHPVAGYRRRRSDAADEPNRPASRRPRVNLRGPPALPPAPVILDTRDESFDWTPVGDSVAHNNLMAKLQAVLPEEFDVRRLQSAVRSTSTFISGPIVTESILQPHSNAWMASDNPWMRTIFLWSSSENTDLEPLREVLADDLELRPARNEAERVLNTHDPIWTAAGEYGVVINHLYGHGIAWIWIAFSSIGGMTDAMEKIPLNQLCVAWDGSMVLNRPVENRASLKMLEITSIALLRDGSNWIGGLAPWMTTFKSVGCVVTWMPVAWDRGVLVDGEDDVSQMLMELLRGLNVLHDQVSGDRFRFYGFVNSIRQTGEPFLQLEDDRSQPYLIEIALIDQSGNRLPGPPYFSWLMPAALSLDELEETDGPDSDEYEVDGPADMMSARARTEAFMDDLPPTRPTLDHHTMQAAQARNHLRNRDTDSLDGGQLPQFTCVDIIAAGPRAIHDWFEEESKDNIVLLSPPQRGARWGLIATCYSRSTLRQFLEDERRITIDCAPGARDDPDQWAVRLPTAGPQICVLLRDVYYVLAAVDVSVFQIRKSDTRWLATESLALVRGSPLSMIGGTHCQEGTDEQLYVLRGVRRGVSQVALGRRRSL